MDLPLLLATALIVWLGTCVQTAAGFGFGLFAVPLLLALGQSLPEAIALAVGASAVQSTLGVVRLRSELRHIPTVPVALASSVTIPLGVLVMHLYLSAHQALTKQVIGAVLIALLVFLQLARPTPVERLGRGWGVLAGAAGGGLAGLAGMGGPPFVLFASFHAWPVSRYRAFLWSQFLIMTPQVILALSLQHGRAVPSAFAWGLAMAPIAWLGIRTGFALSARWTRERSRLVAELILYAIGLSSLLGPFLLP